MKSLQRLGLEASLERESSDKGAESAVISMNFRRHPGGEKGCDVSWSSPQCPSVSSGVKGETTLAHSMAPFFQTMLLSYLFHRRINSPPALMLEDQFVLHQQILGLCQRDRRGIRAFAFHPADPSLNPWHHIWWVPWALTAVTPESGIVLCNFACGTEAKQRKNLKETDTKRKIWGREMIFSQAILRRHSEPLSRSLDSPHCPGESILLDQDWILTTAIL